MRDRLVTHLDLQPTDVGQLGGGCSRPTGVVDVAMVQSLARRDDLAPLASGYGMVIVDECRHVAAVTFERAVREIPARWWVGLTATPHRRDGLQALMAMHCGPVRHTMSAPTGAAPRALDLIIDETSHKAAEEAEHIQTTFRGLVEDDRRTATICQDIVTAAASGRNCLVLTRWTERLTAIADRLARRGVESRILHGQVGKKARAKVVEQLTMSPNDGGLILMATASLLGEGFDCPSLDTHFLAFPIRFKGNVVQYVGRVRRPADTKTRIEVHDCVDVLVPVLARMHGERLRAYAALGFDVAKPKRRAPRPPTAPFRPSRPEPSSDDPF